MTEKTGLKSPRETEARRQKPAKSDASDRPAKVKRTPVRAAEAAPSLQPVPDETRRSSMLVNDAGSPFWIRLPQLALATLKILVMPLIAVRFVLDTVLSACLCAIFVGLGLWGTGVVSNEQAESFLSNLGERSLDLARTLGFPI